MKDAVKAVMGEGSAKALSGPAMETGVLADDAMGSGKRRNAGG